MNKSLSSFLKFTLLLIVGVVLLWFAFRGQDLQKIGTDLLNADYKWIALSIIVSLIAHYIRAIRWKMIIEPAGFDAKNSNVFHAVMIGYLANLAFPRMGEVSRCGVLNRTDKIPVNTLIGTVIAERIIDVLFMLALLGLTVLLQFRLIIGFLNDNLLEPLASKFGTIPLYVWPVLLVLTGAGIYLLAASEKFSENKFIRKIGSVIGGFKGGLLAVLKMKRAGLFLAYSVLIWICYFLSTYLCFFALGATASLGVQTGLFIMVAGSLGMTAPVQGGIGAYHWIVAQALLLYGIDQADGLSFATINHSAQTLLVMVVGSISLLLVFLQSKKSLNNNNE